MFFDFFSLQFSLDRSKVCFFFFVLVVIEQSHCLGHLGAHLGIFVFQEGCQSWKKKKSYFLKYKNQ